MLYRLWKSGLATWTEINTSLSLDDVDLLCLYLDACEDEPRK